jgi:hypothetical protein
MPISPLVLFIFFSLRSMTLIISLLNRSAPTSARAKQAATTAAPTTSRAAKPASATWACDQARDHGRSTSWTQGCFSPDVGEMPLHVYSLLSIRGFVGL